MAKVQIFIGGLADLDIKDVPVLAVESYRVFLLSASHCQGGGW